MEVICQENNWIGLKDRSAVKPFSERSEIICLSGRLVSQDIAGVSNHFGLRGKNLNPTLFCPGSKKKLMLYKTNRADFSFCPVIILTSGLRIRLFRPHQSAEQGGNGTICALAYPAIILAFHFNAQ